MCMKRKAADSSFKSSGPGFTLVELLIAMFIGLVALGAVYTVYLAQQQSYAQLQQRLAVQQNLRAAMLILEQEIRMAGYDPEQSGKFGIVDVRRYDLEENAVNPAGKAALFYTADVDENGVLDDSNASHNKEHINIKIFHDTQTGRFCLVWDNGGGRQTLAENIQSMGLAYGVDVDGDGRLDTSHNGSHTIWAVDADNDNQLDTDLDANGDGRIDANDDQNQDGQITAADGGRIDPPLPVSVIRSVRAWLLSVSARKSPEHYDQQTYMVGDRVLSPARDGYVRRLLEFTIQGRNL